MSEPLLYNPGLMSKDTLLASFVARRPLLDRLTDDLRRQTGQSHLLVGLRGAGKTTLLHRLRYAIDDDPDLRKVYIPLVFPEEQYNVKDLSDLWLNSLDAMADALRLRGEDEQWLDDSIDAIEKPGAQTEERAREALIQAASRLGLRLVLLIDNLELVLGSLEEKQQWTLRELLDGRSPLLMLAASPAVPDAQTQYGKAFYDFLQVHELSALSLEASREVLQSLSRSFNAPNVEVILREQPERIQALHTLSGGSARTLANLFIVLRRDDAANSTVEQVLDALVDTISPLYKARFEELSRQQQVVMHGLCMAWNPCSAGELATQLRMEVGSVSSQLDRLVKSGLVEKVALPGKRRARHGFQVAERFFNIWMLVRAGRRTRRKVLVLSDWLRFIVAPDRVGPLSRQFFADMNLDPALPEALATLASGPLREALRQRAAEALVARGEPLPPEMRDIRRRWKSLGGKPRTREETWAELSDEDRREGVAMFGERIFSALLDQDRLGIEDDAVAAERLACPELAILEQCDSSDLDLLESLHRRYPDLQPAALGLANIYLDSERWDKLLPLARRFAHAEALTEWANMWLMSALHSGDLTEFRQALEEVKRHGSPYMDALESMLIVLCSENRMADYFALLRSYPEAVAGLAKVYRGLVTSTDRLTDLSTALQSQSSPPTRDVLVAVMMLLDAKDFDEAQRIAANYQISVWQLLRNGESLQQLTPLIRYFLYLGAFGSDGARWLLEHLADRTLGYEPLDAALQAFADGNDEALLALAPEARPVAETFLHWMREPIIPKQTSLEHDPGDSAGEPPLNVQG